MINSFLQNMKEYIIRNKKMSVTMLSAWLVITITVGVIVGVRSRDVAVILTPEEENNKAMKIIKGDKEKVDNGLILTPENNLSVNQIELSKDYTQKMKKNSKL